MFTSLILNYSPKNLFLLVKEIQYKILISLKNLSQLMYFFLNNMDIQLKFFSDLLTIDFPIFLFRFTSVYNIISMSYNVRFLLKTILGFNNSINSITSSFTCSSWFERESWDLFGIFYLNNLDLRRILNDYGFFGHPLKKDFPLSGFLEIYIYIFVSLVFYGNIKMGQGFRYFSLTSPWKRRGLC